MKNLLITLFVCTSTYLCADAQTLVLYHADGTTTDVHLLQKPKIQFNNDKVIITSSVLDMDYPKEDVLKFSYKGFASDIQIPSINMEYSREVGLLVFHGIEESDKIVVYNDKGIRLPINLIRQGNDICLPLTDIPSGVYVLSVNGKTSKFLKP